MHKTKKVNYLSKNELFQGKVVKKVMWSLIHNFLWKWINQDLTSLIIKVYPLFVRKCFWTSILHNIYSFENCILFGKVKSSKEHNKLIATSVNRFSLIHFYYWCKRTSDTHVCVICINLLNYLNGYCHISCSMHDWKLS